jgi:phytoene dehydrogenase-like protein
MNDEISPTRVPATTDPEPSVTVVGAGLAGLTAASVAARAGAAVTVLEARTREGGRARSEVRASGAIFNEGPHALYANLAGWHELQALGIDPKGGRPSARAWGRWNGRIDRLPGTTADAVRTRLVGIRAKAQLAKLLADPGRALRGDLSGSLGDWIDRVVSHPDARALLAMVGRTATYVADPHAIAAEAAVPQIVGALVEGVRYLDGGWQQLVDALRDVAEGAGAKIVVDAKATEITRATSDDAWVVRGATDSAVGSDAARSADRYESDAVIIAAGGPRAAANLLGDLSRDAATWASTLTPVAMASLDLHLRALPLPERRACFALDAPIYFSTHTPAAALAPHGEVVQVAWYGEHDDSTLATLESFCDEVQPGWRDQVIDRRFGRRLVPAYGAPHPDHGFAGRPGPVISDCPGAFVAGDWVGRRGLLADASIASGADAARSAMASLAAR